MINTIQAKPFDTGDRVMLNSQLIITMPNRGRTYRFSPEDEFIVVRRKDERNFYVAFIKAPWLGVFELDDESFTLADEDWLFLRASIQGARRLNLINEIK